MILNKLGLYIEQFDVRNKDDRYTKNNVIGISTQKQFIETKADLTGVSLTSYKIVPPNAFAYVSDTSRRGDKMSLAYNDSNMTYLVSSISTVFFVKKGCGLLPDYLFMFFNRSEFDRYTRFNSWGSARETFSWEDMCDIDIELPSLEIQQKYVNVYKAMVANQKTYEKGLDDLKLVCDAYIENIRKNCNCEKILPYLTERNEKNVDGNIDLMKGVGLKGFIKPNQKRTTESLKKCNIFYKNDFVYAPSSLCNGVVAYNNDIEKAICTEEYIVFSINDPNKLNPYYLLMWLKRKELGRLVNFNSMDSVRNRIYFKNLNFIEIPIPDIKIQNNIGKVYLSYLKRQEINEKLKVQIKNICPVLIQGALNEGRKKVI